MKSSLTQHSGDSRPCLFLDRDGVVIHNVPYSKNPDEVVLMPGICELINRARASQHLVIVVTNQSGIGRGWISLDDYRAVTLKMEGLLADRGQFFDRIYFSPYYEQSQFSEYLINPDWRKPGIGMVQQATRDFQIDLKRSTMVGDRMSDMVMASRAGLGKSYLLKSEEFGSESNQIPQDVKYELIDSLEEVSLKFGA